MIGEMGGRRLISGLFLSGNGERDISRTRKNSRERMGESGLERPDFTQVSERKGRKHIGCSNPFETSEGKKGKYITDDYSIGYVNQPGLLR